MIKATLFEWISICPQAPLHFCLSVLWIFSSRSVLSYQGCMFPKHNPKSKVTVFSSSTFPGVLCSPGSMSAVSYILRVLYSKILMLPEPYVPCSWWSHDLKLPQSYLPWVLCPQHLMFPESSISCLQCPMFPQCAISSRPYVPRGHTAKGSNFPYDTKVSQCYYSTVPYSIFKCLWCSQSLTSTTNFVSLVFDFNGSLFSVPYVKRPLF